MQTGSGRRSIRLANRVFNRYALLSLLAFLLVLPASAQQAKPLSESVVLVLKLVSATHVKPTTGIVVSEDGLVLVPADFVSGGGEIVVLDGGTDITGHGRPATISTRASLNGLALLSVEGLKRPGFILSETALTAENSFHLEAFPPAEYIAKGAQPLWVPIEVEDNGSNLPVSVSKETPLPYVTGAIVDDCGYLAGLSLTTGTQSIEPGKIPVVFFRNELAHILESLQISLPGASCGSPLQGVEEPANADSENNVVIKTPQTREPAPGTKQTEPVIDKLPESPVEKPPAVGHKGVFEGPARPTSVSKTERPPLWRSIPFWLLPLVLIVLAVLIWKGIHFFRLTRHETPQTSRTRATLKKLSASDEPETAQLQVGSDAISPKPRSAPLDEASPPDMNALPDGCNGVVVIDGLFDVDTRFKRYCAVNTEQFNIIIGRGEADISIEHPAISRVHARLESDAEIMTLSDLGSSNGTFINGTPCLPAEIMFIEPGDEIYLGEVRFSISVIRKESELS
jgi:hypothetical protein